MNLVRAEFRRLIARRFSQVLLALLAGAFVITFASATNNTHPPTAVEVAVAEGRAEQGYAFLLRSYQGCLARQGDTGARAPIEQMCGRPPARPDPYDNLFGVFVFEGEIGDLLYFLTAFLGLVGLLVGASSVGAERSSGGMTNLLLWQPRRVLVLGTKLGVLLGGMLVASIAAAAVYLGTFYWLARSRGLVGTLDAAFWTGLGAQAIRSVLFTLALTAIGFGLATIGRHTAAALGVVGGYLVLWEIGARIVMEVNDVTQGERLMLSSYLYAALSGEYAISDFGGCGGDLAPCGAVISAGQAAVVWTLSVAAVLGTAFATFRKRDLT